MNKTVSHDLFDLLVNREVFFTPIGWWMLKKKQQVIQNGQKLSFDDLLEESIVKYQHKFYIPLVIVFGFIIPTLLPYYCWNEDLLTAFLIASALRTVVVLHHLFTVNSVSHFWGYRYELFNFTNQRLVNLRLDN